MPAKLSPTGFFRSLGVGAPGLTLALVLGVLGCGTQPGTDGAKTDNTVPVEPPRGELSSDPGGPAWFQDRTAGSGLEFTHRNGEEADQFTILETLGGGVGLLDYDGDGLLDVFVTGGGYFEGPDKKQVKGHPCKLYKNLGNWKFEDVTAQVGLGTVAWWYTHGVAVADYDRDGFPDLLVTGYGRLALFHNEKATGGGRTFVDATESLRLSTNSWTTSAGWADLDGDGFPDLYLCHYCDWSPTNNPPCIGQAPNIPRDVCPPHRFKPLLHAVHRNENGKAFHNLTRDQGLKLEGYGLGVVLADINADGRPDIFVANDMSPNFLILNHGGKFEEIALAAGVALDDAGRTTAGMGVAIGEYDGSGRAALFVTTFQRELPSLYRNLGQDRFLYQSHAAGLAAQGRTNVGWGTGFVDVDNDGWEDLVIANGHLFRQPAGAPLKQRPLLLRNVAQEGRRVFKDLAARGGTAFQAPNVGRGLAIGDLDNDGWPDLVLVNTNSPVTLVQNVAGATEQSRWLGVKLTGRGQRDVVGSTVILEGSTRKLTRFAQGGGSYLSASDSRLLFGLGASEQVRRVTVRWAWGETQTWDNLEPGRYYELREGEVAARPLPPR